MDKKKKIILTVDDVSMNLVIVKNILSPFFDVRVAKSGEIALNILSRLPVELILLDIEMPKMSGLELMQILKDRPELSQIPVICITSHADKTDAAEILSAGAKDCMSKPVDPDALMEKVFRILNIET